MFSEMLQQTFLGNRLIDYLISLGVCFVSILIVKFIIHHIVRRIEKIAQKNQKPLNVLFVTILEKIFLPALYLSCFHLPFKMLQFSSKVYHIIDVLQLLIIIAFAGQLIIVLIDYAFNIYVENKENDSTLKRSLSGVLSIIKFFIWTIALLIFLDNIGFKISTMLAGLGIGGIAVAIAAQALLKDFFGFFSIVFDRPFKLGDFIIVGDVMGTVEYIGIKTTRIRSLSGEEVVLSNTDLTDSRVRNYKMMEKRRIMFRLGVTYQTPLENLKQIPIIIENMIKNTQGTAFDRAHFATYGDFSLIFEVVYFVLSPDYNQYMDIQQQINFAIKEEFERKNIAFAYPTQTVYLPK